MSLVERYCKKCINYEMCQSTGCTDKYELEELVEFKNKYTIDINDVDLDFDDWDGK